MFDTDTRTPRPTCLLTYLLIFTAIYVISAKVSITNRKIKNPIKLQKPFCVMSIQEQQCSILSFAIG